MGIYATYLNNNLQNFDAITSERKKILSNISKLRNRDILVFSSDLSKNMIPIGIEYADILAVQDQLDNMSETALDIILETPGGMGEIVEDIVKLIRQKYEKIGIIIPGSAKSAGTIFAMAGDEILMGPSSSLGPIDGQLQLGNGKSFSADAFLEGLKKIKDDVEKTKKLNTAYIPILQNISPGEIQKCENIQDFSKSLVTDWLAKYKFKYWDKHSDGRVVTENEKYNRAKTIATDLCSQSKWLIHGRSIKIQDLENLKIKITDYSKNRELNDAITRYYTLLRMSFENSTAYKIFETVNSQIYRFMVPVQPAQNLSNYIIDVSCSACKHRIKIQVNLEKDIPLEKGTVSYPVDTDLINCPQCNEEINLKHIRQKVEQELGKKVI